MTQYNRKKLSISLSVSESLLKKIDIFVESGQFATISDLVYVSVCEFLGIVSFCENDPKFDLETFLAAIEDDAGPKMSISVTINSFVSGELKRISRETYKNQSVIIRKAVIYFMDRCNKKEAVSKKTAAARELLTAEQEVAQGYPMSEKELKDFIILTINEINEKNNRIPAGTVSLPANLKKKS